MRALGEQAGLDVVCVLTDMDQPLGRAVGNALEVREAWDTVSGGGPPDFRELVVDAAAQLLALSDLGRGRGRGEAPRRRRRSATARLSPRTTAGCGRRAATPIRLGCRVAPVVRTVAAPASGYVRELRAREVAVTAMELGAGREVAGEPIDHAVGVVCQAKRGDPVERGDALAEIHARDEAAAEAAEAGCSCAYEIGDEPEPRPLVLDVIH